MHGKAPLLDITRFVVAHGWRARGCHLAKILGQTVEDIERIRRTNACKKVPKGKGFAELFALWHGRPPEDHEWPAPQKVGTQRAYEWLAPEVALLASLVGQMGVKEIARVLTARLRQQTGDRAARRTATSVQVRANSIGLQISKDVLGGITTAEAGREIGSLPIVYQAIENQQLITRLVGRIRVIPYDAWEAWKAKRVFPPAGYVQLSTIRETLAIRSDKLSEFARMGLIPTAIRCNPYGTKARSTQFGTWYIDKKVARKLVADRRAGRPMPWHGKPLQDNLRVTYRLWVERKHPASCPTCAEIWGRKGIPRSFDEYAERYPPLAHGAKRHLTRVWTPGLTVAEVARHAGSTVYRVRRAIENGVLATTSKGRRKYVSRTDATRWKARRCPTGTDEKSWLSLETASKLYLFTERELRGFIKRKNIKSRVGTFGAANGVTYVLKHQCAQLREKRGFTEGEAARRAGVSVSRLRTLLRGVDWRKAEGIPLVTIQAVIKRLESREGYTIDEAAKVIRKPRQWIQDRIQDGTIRVTRAKWDRRRVYISAPMLRRLEAAKSQRVREEHFGKSWLLLSDAAKEAGVTAATVIRWAENGEVTRKPSRLGWRYPRKSVRAQAQRYWRTVRFRRATPPAWLRNLPGVGRA